MNLTKWLTKCEGSLPKAKGKTHYMVKMMHIAELKLMKGNKCKGANQNGKRKQKQEHNYKEQRCNGTMEEVMETK